MYDRMTFVQQQSMLCSANPITVCENMIRKRDHIICPILIPSYLLGSYAPRYTVFPDNGTMGHSLSHSRNLYLCFILSTLWRWGKSAAIQELFGFLRIGTKQYLVPWKNMPHRPSSCVTSFKTDLSRKSQTPDLSVAFGCMSHVL